MAWYALSVRALVTLLDGGWGQVSRGGGSSGEAVVGRDRKQIMHINVVPVWVLDAGGDVVAVALTVGVALAVGVAFTVELCLVKGNNKKILLGNFFQNLSVNR